MNESGGDCAPPLAVVCETGEVGPSGGPDPFSLMVGSDGAKGDRAVDAKGLCIAESYGTVPSARARASAVSSLVRVAAPMRPIPHALRMPTTMSSSLRLRPR